jgi:hypothetical protein
MNNKHGSRRRCGEQLRRSSVRRDCSTLVAEDGSFVKSHTYVTDDLVLTVVERDAPSYHERDVEREARTDCDRLPVGELVSRRLRTTVAALANRRVTALLSGARTDPDVTFDLFLFEE